MRKFEGKIGLNNNSSSLIINNNQSLQNSFCDDEFILYINELISSIKHLYKINSLNFNNIKSVLSKPESFNSNEFILNTNNNVNKNLFTSFQQIESSFTSFYTNAKGIIKKMKNYQCTKINNGRKNDNGKIYSYDKISQTSNPINNNISVNNNIYNSTNLSNNNIYIKKTDNLMKNIRNKFQKIKSEKEDLQLSNNSTKNLIESYNNYMNYSQNFSNSYRNIVQNNSQNSLNLSNNIQTIYLSNSLNKKDNGNNKKINLLEEECEKYIKTLNDFSIDVYHFLGTVVNLQKYFIKNIPENLILTFEKEKKILTQKCSTYISNYEHNNIEKSKFNYSIQNLKTESNINENEYDKLKNKFDLINKELYITQRENNELREEVHFLIKSFYVDNNKK